MTDERATSAPALYGDLPVGRIWAMIESAPDGMLLADADGTILVANRQLEVLFGYDRDDLIGSAIELLVPEQHRDVHRVHRARFSGAPTVREMGAHLELCGRRRDGSEFPVEISLSPIVDDGEVTVVASIRDVSARVDAERRLQAERARVDVLEDRERIGRDLHDVVIQRLFAAGMGLQSVLPRIEAGAVVDRIQVTIDELDMTIRELRSAIFGLSSADLLRSTADQVRATVHDQTGPLGFAPTVEFRGDVESVPLVVVEQMLPSLAELLTNVARHAGASSAAVTVTVGDGIVEVVVRDDGRGVAGDSVGGRGLTNLEARARRVGGSFTVGPAPDRGTVVRWTGRI